MEAIIVPGWQDSGPAHWQTLWQHDEGWRRVRQADWQHPDPGDWVEAIDRAVRECTQAPVLVAHSLGCIAVAQWSRDCTAPVRAALLVAPADVEAVAAPAEIAVFAPIARQPLRFPAMVVASRNDPYDPACRARDFAQAWGCEHVDLGDAGHINAESGRGEWPRGRELLSRLLARAGA